MERFEFADVEDGTHVPFQIGGDVITKPNCRVEFAVEDSRIAAGKESLIQSGRIPGESRGLAVSEWQQVMHRRAASQGLADGGHQGQVAGTDQNPAAGRRIIVYDALQIGQKIRRALHFVQNRTCRELSQKSTWVARCERTLVGSFKRDIGMVGKQGAAQGRFAALARPGQRNGR